MMSFHDLTDHWPIEDDDFENCLRGKSPEGIPNLENIQKIYVENLIKYEELTGTMVILRDTVRI